MADSPTPGGGAPGRAGHADGRVVQRPMRLLEGWLSRAAELRLRCAWCAWRAFVWVRAVTETATADAAAAHSVAVAAAEAAGVGVGAGANGPTPAKDGGEAGGSEGGSGSGAVGGSEEEGGAEPERAPESD